jgi:phosphoglycolate phosphatase-like HAD superfamily hydrolase
MNGKFGDIQAVIFDLDGTLVSVEERFYRVFLDTLKAYHQPTVEKEIFMKKFSMNELDDFLDLEDEHAFWVDFLKAYNGSYNELSKMIPGAREVLKKLKDNGVKIGVITGRLSDPEEILAELHRFNLGSFVDAVVTKKLVFAQLKPDELFSRSLELIQVLEKIGAEPSRSILVADYVVDIESAKNLGLRAVAVLSGSSDYESLRKMGPDAIIKSVVELPKLLGQ